MDHDTALERAATALERGAWAEALELLDEIEQSGGDLAVVYELRAQAAYGAGEFEAAVEAWERLHAHERARGNSIAAAQAAAMIAMYLMMDTGMMAPVRGWLRTAERLLDGHADTAAHALIAMTRTYERFMCGDMDAAREQSARAIELGEVTGVTPAVVIGRVASARVRIFDGDLDEGLRQLEEVGALLLSGGADPLTTGMMYCELICAAQGLGRHDMAVEWTDVMETWRHGAAFGGINGRCRVHRAEMLRVSGPCDAAEAEALGACDELRPWMRREFGWPLVELGNIRLRRGDLSGAESAFLEAHDHAWSPQPGLAMVHHEHGDSQRAATMLRDAIEHPFDIPSKERPPFGDLRLAPLLDAQCEVAAALGDRETARTAASRLASIAADYPGVFLTSWAALAEARVALLDGDPGAAIDAARRAANAWADVGAPYEAAAARVVIGRAYAADGNTDAAEMEWRAAERAFAAFGAEGRAAATAALGAGPTGRPAAPVATDPPEAPLVGFTVEGDQRLVVFRGRTATIRNLKGLRYVARLVAEPGRELHVLDLVAAEEGVLRPVAGADAGLDSGGMQGLPVLDDVAREAYRRRLAEIDDDIEEANRLNDPGRAMLAERDRDYLIAELRRAVGLGGRSRTIGGSVERARTSVTRSIRYGIEQLGAVQPELAAHLSRAVRTGVYCAYEADPVSPLRWRC